MKGKLAIDETYILFHKTEIHVDSQKTLYPDQLCLQIGNLSLETRVSFV